MIDQQSQIECVGSGRPRRVNQSTITWEDGDLVSMEVVRCS